MKSKHKKSSYFSAMGLFRSIVSFAELEARIFHLPQIERGDAFEVFAEAYFNTQKIHQTKEVWPDSEIPQSLRQKLGLPSTDKGIDGVFLSHDNQYHAYQVKYRSNRLSLAWEELSTFMGLSDKSDQRVLFTNSTDISSVMEDRTDFYSIKGNDLDALEQSDFSAIENWLESGLVVRSKKSPLPHQEEAIRDIVHGFKSNDRATAIMACGTGKTLVALWTAEKQKAQTILVLLPSLALVRQTLHDWAKENNWDDFNYLCVCSDATVAKGIDETILNQHDLDFPVTTQKEVVYDFLMDKDIARKIIFSTYQSCQVVSEGMPQDFAFDLAIFDEAHKTAALSGANYAFALQDSNLFIRKRLFLTATPRHYNINKRNEEGDQHLVYSMDDDVAYGPKIHQLSFRKAVENDLICDYRVIISIVTTDMINRELLRKGEVVIGGDVIKAQRMANIMALQIAVDKYGVKKIFSFHNTVKAAKSFTSNGKEGVGAYLSDFVSLHVSGEMASSMRDNLLKEFKRSDKAIISNARCLTEGVDVPAVDLVAFISPKKSQVDIVQAAGRAMRKSPGKECGYILIPLFVHQAEDEKLEDALEKTRFQTVWDVLQAMQEQDESLVEIIAQMREDRGKALGFNDNRLRERVEVLGPELCISELRNSINTKIINQLGSNWDERFGELVKFNEKYRHCNVPQKYTKNKDLGTWVSVQRWAYKIKRISLKHIKKLESIGFKWNQNHDQWDQMYVRLSEYIEKNGDSFVPRDYSQDSTLATWVADQRKMYNKKKLSQNRIAQLESIGFYWDPLDRAWEARFSELCEYKEKNGAKVPGKNSKHHNLAIWMQHQRIYYREGRLPDDRIAKLESIGFDWDPLSNTWSARFNELLEYKDVHGDFNVPQEYQESSLLRTWLNNQRSRYKQNKLSPERVALFESINFNWSPLQGQWERMFKQLCKFREDNDHTNVPKRYKPNPELGTWCQNQRNDFKCEKMTQDRIKKLESIGFIWDPIADQWERMFVELHKYYDANGNCAVPHRYLKNPTLGLWVGVQRRNYKDKTISCERIKKLESINFNFDPIGSIWDLRFAELCKYKKVYGHCNVSPRFSENLVLWRWTHNQRSLYKKKNLEQDRIERLNDLGFIWKIKT